MPENGNHAYDLASDDQERENVPNDKGFEPLLDTDEAARLLENAPQNSSNEGADRFDTGRPGRKAMALSSFDAGSLAGKTRQLNERQVEDKKISTETHARSILTVSADTV